MATAVQKITLSSSRDIPFNKLVLSQSNVRRVKSGISIEELAEDIARRTLLQSLNVRPVLDAEGAQTGMFEIPAGGRRYRALELLVKQKRLAKNAPVPCVVRDAATDILAEDDSLAENVQRAPLHPLDQFRAFQAMREKGRSEEDIAAAFFTSANVVRQRLRLASVSPKLLDIYAEDGISLEQLMAFTVSSDHARQEQVWETISGSWSKEPTPDLASLGLAPQPATPSAQDRQLAFLNAAADRRTVAPDRVAAPASPNILQAGAIISAALITGIRSDLPGQITAQVTENIYDSPTGRILLVPQGTRIIGQYDNNVQFGQSRVLLVWNRLIFPNGRSIVLERQPGADAEGYAGLQDGVDYHWWDLAKAAGLSTLLSIGAELATNDDDRLIQAIRNGGQDTINDAGQQIVRRQLNVAPTLTIRPGFPVRVIVTRDLVLEPYGG
ncbi:TrbI/VirB10 family protein [Enhydrobacter sp.]|jgi:ParB/RepB/Spo0J family partition protein|uniref:TrbI/VirB10 family protein n=1 Tax=Enhydrobacter sp. TaxID=1894999 RepID=UPI00261F7C72|nr:TrbI/VirB10 family protein [Enhydrobacter sp.]WIM13824.1 MAG: Conjugative transfer protein TrbI [Enhydrobacter sp.]